MKIKEIFQNMTYGSAPESAAQANEFLENHNKIFDLFIDGKWTTPLSGKYIESHNPANKEFLAKIADANTEDVDLAVKAAKNAQQKWLEIGAFERSKFLYAIARQIQKHARLFSVLETLDNGKPIRESRDIDIPLVVRHFYHHAGWAKLMDSELKDYQPVGVVGQIIPWNFPLLMLSWKIAPALAMGNCIVLKPAEYTSLTALLFAEICQKVGLPNGVINIITGKGSECGAALVNHNDINKIAFTGSTEVGKIIRKSLAGTGKKLSLELGGKSPFMVFEDADLDSAIEGVVDAIWFNQGQVCCAGSRLLVQESIAETFYDKLKARMKKLRLGNPLDKCIDMGTLVDEVQWKSIDQMLKIAKKEGMKIWQSESDCPTGGHFYPPTLLTDVSPSSHLAQEEIFGPVLVAMTFRTHKEAIALANNTKYGLACSIWTENINLALEIAPQIKAGVAWINSTNMFDAAAGFGGYKESGFGREGGKEGLLEYLQPKLDSEFSDKPFVAKIDTKHQSKNTKNNIDRTSKLFVGGKQARPDSGYSLEIKNPKGEVIGEVGQGSRKDIRNAVEAAQANAWGKMTGHARAQVLYYMAENLSIRANEFAQRLVEMTQQSLGDAHKEVEKSIERVFTYAAYADKYDGAVHSTLQNFISMALPEAMGVVGVVCPNESPLLGFISCVMPNLAMGNAVVVVPSETHPFSACDFYQIIETSDVPAGAINIITGNKNELGAELAKHYNLDGLWFFGTKEEAKPIETLASESMKPTWLNYGKYRNWLLDSHGEGEIFLRKATQIKNIWVPYGV